MILDVYSRLVVGWCVSHPESAELAEKLTLDARLLQNVERGQLTIHADRGSAMTSKVVAQLLCDLGIEKTHSRPHVSNDNPYSEAQFKTLKFRPDFPELFGSLFRRPPGSTRPEPIGQRSHQQARYVLREFRERPSLQ